MTISIIATPPPTVSSLIFGGVDSSMCGRLQRPGALTSNLLVDAQDPGVLPLRNLVIRASRTNVADSPADQRYGLGARDYFGFGAGCPVHTLHRRMYSNTNTACIASWVLSSVASDLGQSCTYGSFTARPPLRAAQPRLTVYFHLQKASAFFRSSTYARAIRYVRTNELLSISTSMLMDPLRYFRH
jgi:hypothetical protein